MGSYAKLGFCAVLPRDRTGGRVKIGKDGQPIVEYPIRDDDSRRIVEGLVNAGKVMEAAGAKEVYSIHRDPIRYTPNGPSAHDKWADEVRARGFSARVATGVSYHQMGSCRMGVDPTTSAIGPDNETHECNDLFVVDASTFPTASGVNPMLSIYGIAHRAATRIATRYA
jgi:choline dehydrogenase-like flavoprotein